MAVQEVVEAAEEEAEAQEDLQEQEHNLANQEIVEPMVMDFREVLILMVHLILEQVAVEQVAQAPEEVGV